MIEFDCPHCQHHITASDRDAGNAEICPKCNARVAIPQILGAGASNGVAPGARIPCPICGETIAAQTSKCPFCGELLGTVKPLRDNPNLAGASCSKGGNGWLKPLATAIVATLVATVLAISFANSPSTRKSAMRGKTASMPVPTERVIVDKPDTMTIDGRAYCVMEETDSGLDPDDHFRPYSYDMSIYVRGNLVGFNNYPVMHSEGEITGRQCFVFNTEQLRQALSKAVEWGDTLKTKNVFDKVCKTIGEISMGLGNSELADAQDNLQERFDSADKEPILVPVEFIGNKNDYIIRITFDEWMVIVPSVFIKKWLNATSPDNIARAIKKDQTERARNDELLK